MSVLAIDAGTTGVTAVVVSPQGRIVASAGQELAQHSPRAGWVEHAPEEIWQATLGATHAVLAQVDPSELTAVGITNQRETVVLWDRETLGSPRRAIGQHDRRTADVCERLRAAGHEARVAELTGLRLDPCFSGTKLAWLAESEPHTWALVESGRYAVGTVDSYLVARMTRGTWHVTDVSNASRTLLLDLGTGEWSDELCDLFGVPRDALPDLVPSWGEVAPTDPRSFLGLELPIAGIAGDQQSALFGQTCFEVGDARCGYGAGGVTVLVNTGSMVERSDVAMLSTAAWRSPDGELSYALEGRIDAATGKDTASGVRDVLAAVPPVSVLRVDGDVDDERCRLLAVRTGLPVERLRVIDAPARGAALLAGLGTGVWDSLDELRDDLRDEPGDLRATDRRFEPATD